MTVISEEEVVKRSLEISKKLYYRVMLNSSRVILDFIGLSSTVTFLLMSFTQDPLTLNVSILTFSTIYVIISWIRSRHIIPLAEAIDKTSIVKNLGLINKLSYTLALVVIYLIFLLSFLDHSLFILPALLVGSYLSLDGFQLICIIRFLKSDPVEYVLVASYVISGISVILSPFYPLSLLFPPTLGFLYRLVRRAKEWS